jgi:serine/threonine-protein kinase
VVPVLPPPVPASPHGAPETPARIVEPARARAPVRRERATRTGELAILVKPWATIWLNGKPSGQTPFRGPVPAGRYQIRIANDDVGRDEVTTITVEPDQIATLERTW